MLAVSARLTRESFEGVITFLVGVSYSLCVGLVCPQITRFGVVGGAGLVLPTSLCDQDGHVRRTTCRHGVMGGAVLFLSPRPFEQRGHLPPRTHKTSLLTTPSTAACLVTLMTHSQGCMATSLRGANRKSGLTVAVAFFAPSKAFVTDLTG